MGESEMGSSSRERGHRKSVKSSVLRLSLPSGELDPILEAK
jgi:hypothetical protein